MKKNTLKLIFICILCINKTISQENLRFKLTNLNGKEQNIELPSKKERIYVLFNNITCLNCVYQICNLLDSLDKSYIIVATSSKSKYNKKIINDNILKHCSKFKIFFEEFNNLENIIITGKYPNNSIFSLFNTIKTPNLIYSKNKKIILLDYDNLFSNSLLNSDTLIKILK